MTKITRKIDRTLFSQVKMSSIEMAIQVNQDNQDNQVNQVILIDKTQIKEEAFHHLKREPVLSSTK